MLHAPVPRALRVRASVQIAGQRLPALGFLFVAGVVFLGGIAVVFGAHLEQVVWATGVAALIGLVALEGRLWGRSSHEILRIVARHYRRPGRLWRAVATLVLPTQEAGSTVAVRRPRWMDEART